MAEYHLAQLNIAHLLAPLESPQLKDFVDNLDRINALADQAEGFVWRYIEAEDHNPPPPDIFGSEMVIVNMSVWESIDALYQYTYYSDHADIFRRRREWFSLMKSRHMVMWWVPVGHIPTVQEANERLQLLNAHGPTPRAFTFKQKYSPSEN